MTRLSLVAADNVAGSTGIHRHRTKRARHEDDLLEIFERLESLKAKAQSLGKEREKLQQAIADAEAKLDEARRLVEAAEGQLGQGPK